jgi:hypothetical protein
MSDQEQFFMQARGEPRPIEVLQGKPLSQDSLNYLKQVAAPTKPVTLDDMLKDFETFKVYDDLGAFDADASAWEMIKDGGYHIAVDTGAWLATWPERIASNFFEEGKEKASSSATQMQLYGNVAINWEALLTGVKRLGMKYPGEWMGDFHQAIGTTDITDEEFERSDKVSSYEFWRDINELEKKRASLVVDAIKDESWLSAGLSPETKQMILSGEATPDMQVAMGGSMWADPINYIPFGAAFKVGGKGSNVAFRGVESALIKETQDMIAMRAMIKNNAQIAGRAGFQAAKGQDKALVMLDAMIKENGKKIGALASKRDVALNTLSKQLPGGHPLKEVIDESLEGIAIKGRSTLAAKAAGASGVLVGKTLENIGNTIRFLQTLPVETATNIMIKMGIPEEKAVGFFSSGLAKKTALVGGSYVAIDYFTDDELLAIGGSAAMVGLPMLARYGRDLSIAGRELMLAETTLPYFKRLGSHGAETVTERLVDRSVFFPFRSVAEKAFGTAEGKLAQRALSPTGKLSGGTQGVVDFLNTTKTGRWVEQAGRVTAGVGTGASIGGIFGFAASGGGDMEEAFYGGIGAGAGLGFFGGALGSLGRIRGFRNSNEVTQARYGDWTYYKDNLLPAGMRDAFDAMPRQTQMAYASYQMSYPDVQINYKRNGKNADAGGHYTQDGQSIIDVNADSGRAIDPLLSHEITHHLDKVGGSLPFNEMLIGNALLDQPGLFTAKDKDGNYIKIGESGNPNNPLRYKTNKEFNNRRREYGRKRGLSDEAIEQVMTDEITVREIVAEHGTDFFLNDPRRYRDLHEGPIGAIMRGLVDGPFLNNVPFLRNFLAKLGGTFRADGTLTSPNNIFSKMERIPGVTELIRRYNREIEGLSPKQREKKFPMPEGKPMVKVTGAELAKNPELVELLRAGTILKVDENGNVVTDLAMTPREANKYNKTFTEALKSAIEKKEREDGLPDGHVRETQDAAGRTVISGRFLSNDVIDILEASGSWNKEQIANLRKINNTLAHGKPGNEFLIHYFKASSKRTGRKYVNASVETLVEVPYGIELSKKGNILIRTVNVDQLTKNVDKLVKQQAAEVSRLYGTDLDAATTAIIRDIDTYHKNHAEGRPGETGLDADPQIALAKKNLINSAFGRVRKEQLDTNPWLAQLGKKEPRPTYRSRRIERIGKADQLSGERYVDPNLFAKNFLPPEQVTGVEAQIKTLQEQLQFLGGDELIPGFKIQDFLNNEEKVQYLESLRDFRKLAQEIENMSGREEGGVRYDPSDPKFVVLAEMLAPTTTGLKPKVEQFIKARAKLSELHIAAAQRNKFRTDGKYLALPAEETYTTRTGRGMEELTARDAMLRPDARAILEGGRPMSKEVLGQTTKGNATKALKDAFGESTGGIKKLIANVWRAIAMDDKSFKYIKSGEKDIGKIAKEYGIPVRSLDVAANRNADTRIVFGDSDGFITASTSGGKFIGVNSTLAKQSNIPNFGQRTYQALLDYAHNNEMIYVGDTLSKVNELRVTTAQLSSALKHGTTKHFRIIEDQGFTKAEVEAFGKDYDTDIATLALKEAEQATMVRQDDVRNEYDFTALQDLRYDFSKGEFYKIDDSNNRMPVDEGGIKALLEGTDPGYEAGVGASTAKRAIVTRSLLRPPPPPQKAADGSGMGDGGSFLAKGREAEAFTSGSLEKTLYMPKKDEGEAFARPLEEILERIPENERFVGNKAPGQPHVRPNGRPFLEADLDAKIGPLHIKQANIDKFFQDSIDEAGPAGRRAIEQMAQGEEGVIMTPPDEAHWRGVEKLTLRDRFWYEISSEAMNISFPDHVGPEKVIIPDMTAATSPLAHPNYNSELMISIMSEAVRNEPSTTPAVVQKSVAEAFSGEFGKNEARKVGSFAQSFKFFMGLDDSPPLSTNDRQVAASFNIPDEAFGKYPVLYEVVARFYNKLRDHTNAERTKRNQVHEGPVESPHMQAGSWVQKRAENLLQNRKKITEEEAFEGDAYANGFKLAADKLREAGIKIDKDPGTGLPLFTKEVLADPRVVETLSPLAIKFRQDQFGTMEIVSLLHEAGAEFAKLMDRSLEVGSKLNLTKGEKLVRKHLKKLLQRKKVGDKQQPSMISELAQMMTGDKDEVTRIELGYGTFEGAMSQNLRIPMSKIPEKHREAFLAILGQEYMQAAQAASNFTVTDSANPATYSVFIKGLKDDNPAIKTFAESLSDIGHEANISQRPNGLVLDINPMFLEDFSTQAPDFTALNKLLDRTFPEYDSQVTGQSYDSIYIEKADYNTAIANFKKDIRNEYIRRIQEATGVKKGLAENYLRGAGPELQAEKAPVRKRVERIRSAYDKHIRDRQSVVSKLRKAAKQLEKDTAKLNPELTKRIDRQVKANIKRRTKENRYSLEDPNQQGRMSPVPDNRLMMPRQADASLPAMEVGDNRFMTTFPKAPLTVRPSASRASVSRDLLEKYRN